MATFGKIDMITKMFRSLPFKIRKQSAPSKGATVYRIERVPTADRFRIIYGIEVLRAMEVSGTDLVDKFAKTMHMLSDRIIAESKHYQGMTIHQVLEALEEKDDIVIEANL